MSLPGFSAGNQPANEFLDAVREVAATEGYEILGEMGQGRDLSIVYLAREMRSHKLVALKLQAGAGDEYILDLIQELDESVPSVEGECPRCATVSQGWKRFCTRCGFELAGAPDPSPALLEAVKEAAGHDYEILGEMSHATGGGRVYFARENASGNLVALRVREDKKDEYAMAMTGVLKPLAEKLGSGQKPPAPGLTVPPLGRPPTPRAPVISAPPVYRAPAPRTPTSIPITERLQQPLFLGLGFAVVILLLLIVLVAVLR